MKANRAITLFTFYILSLLLSCAFAVNASKFAFKVQDVNVGFPTGQDPVPNNCAQCLNVQEVFDTTTTINYASDVEPSITVNPANPCNVIGVWQDSRISNGGALEGGIAYSFDGGKTWKQTVVPTQICIGGFTQRISDPWLSYSADGSTAYFCFLFLNATEVPNTQNQQGIAVSRSTDGGVTWSVPTILVSSFGYLNEPTGLFEQFDKSSITADPNNANFAYSVWDQFTTLLTFHSNTMISRTTDKGLTWSTPALVYDPSGDLNGLSNGNPDQNGTITNTIVVLPKSKSGDLLNFMTRYYATPNATNPADYENDAFPYQFTTNDIALVRSKDNGLTWDTKATIVVAQTQSINAVVYTGGYTYSGNTITGGVGTALRTSNGGVGANTGGNLFGASVNPCNGNLYVVWQTGQFRADQLPQIAIATSRDGGFTWSNSAQVSRTPSTAANPQAFTPFVAASKDGYVAVIYSDFRFDPSSGSGVPNNPATLTDTWLAIYKEVKMGCGSTGIGLDFVQEFRLSNQSYIAQNGPETSQGVMTNGDYSTVVAQKDSFYAIYTQSFNGPFTSTNCLPDIVVNNEQRSAPFVSVVTKK